MQLAKRTPLKLSRRKRQFAIRRLRRGQDAIDLRKAELEAEVNRGVRDARTLVTIPSNIARDATLRFPPHPFGEPEAW